MSDAEAPRRLRFFETVQHPCSYLPGRWARTVVADPRFPADRSLYTLLSQHGFRRSGEHIYRPVCPGCDACVPVRLPVREFRPRRSQRRVARRNADLRLSLTPAAYHEEHFELYWRYQQARHGDGEMALHGPDDYRGFLLSNWCDTYLLEMRSAARLVGVGVLDRLEDGLSAVYTFFHPGESARSPGVLAVLAAIDEARRRGLDYLYLGYWIAECAKMAYKADYLPQERLRDGRWRRIEE